MRVLYPLQKDHFIVYHSLVALDILLKYNLDCITLAITFGFSDYPISSCAQGPSKFVLRSKSEHEQDDL